MDVSRYSDFSSSSRKMPGEYRDDITIFLLVENNTFFHICFDDVIAIYSFLKSLKRLLFLPEVALIQI